MQTTTATPASAGSQAGPRCSGSRGRQQALNAVDQRAAAGGHGEGRIGLAVLFDVDQGTRIDHAIATELGGEIVAAVLSFDANLAGNPPDRGVIEEQRVDGGLQQIDEVIVAADMGQFVRQQSFQGAPVEAGERCGGHEDYRAQPSDHAGSLGHAMDGETHRDGHGGAAHKAAQGAVPIGRDSEAGGAAQAMQIYPGADPAQG